MKLLLTALLSVVSLVLVGLGFGAMLSPLVPVAPSSVPLPIVLLIGLALLAAGVSLWIFAWRRHLKSSPPA